MIYANTYGSIYYDFSGETLEYKLRVRNPLENIFYGLANAMPGTSGGTINIGKIMYGYVSSTLSDLGTGSVVTALWHSSACRTFDLIGISQDGSGETVETVLETYKIRVGDGDFSASDSSLSVPVNGHTDPRMRILYTAYRQNTGGTICYLPKHEGPSYIEYRKHEVPIYDNYFTDYDGNHMTHYDTDITPGSDGWRRTTFSGPLYRIENKAFRMSKRLIEIILPDCLVEIGAFAFDSTTGLTSVQFGTGLKVIEEEAFVNCSGLTSITLRGNIDIIGSEAFSLCRNLTSITFDGTVKKLSNCFRHTNVSYVYLPDGLEHMVATFEFCTSLTGVSIPSSTVIIRCAFEYCTSLTDITFRGTKAEWNNISFESHLGINIPATVVHCTDGDVPIPPELR